MYFIACSFFLMVWVEGAPIRRRLVGVHVVPDYWFGLASGAGLACFSCLSASARTSSRMNRI